MARKSTIAFAEKCLSPEHYAAWLAMPVKLSKSQLLAGEKPPLDGAAATVVALAAVAAIPEEEEDEEDQGDLEEGDLNEDEDDEGAAEDEKEHPMRSDLAGDLIAIVDEMDKAEDQEEAMRSIACAFWECMDRKSRLAAMKHEDILDLLEEEDEDEDETED